MQGASPPRLRGVPVVIESFCDRFLVYLYCTEPRRADDQRSRSAFGSSYSVWQLLQQIKSKHASTQQLRT